MFLNVIVIAALALTASAAPLLPPRGPAVSMGTAFRLVVKVKTADFADSPVNNHEVSIAHTIPGSNRAVISASPTSPTVFYQNGTQTERDLWIARLVNDTPQFPQGFFIDYEGSGGPTGDVFDVSINAGPGSQSIMVSPDSQPLAYIDLHGLTEDLDLPSSFIVCDNAGKRVLDWCASDNVPSGCVAVDLVPQCETLPALPVNATWSHEFVQEVRCYEDVAAITEWP